MNKEHQKLAIIQACQWDRRQEGAQVWYEKDGKFVAHHNTMLNDLNAMNTAVMTLDRNTLEYSNYCSRLQQLVAIENSKTLKPGIQAIDATAGQRAAAFLFAKNLWTPTGEENE